MTSSEEQSPLCLTLHDLFARQAGATPDRIAVVCEGHQLSYGELDLRSNRLARHLGLLGVGLEALVGLYLEPSVELLVSIVGILKAGASYVPLDPAYPAARRQCSTVERSRALFLGRPPHSGANASPIRGRAVTRACDPLCIECHRYLDNVG